LNTESKECKKFMEPKWVAGRSGRESEEVQVFYKHYGMARAWEQVKKAQDFDAWYSWEDYDPLSANFSPRKFLTNCDLHVWCCLLETARRPSVEWPPDITHDRHLLDTFLEKWQDLTPVGIVSPMSKHLRSADAVEESECGGAWGGGRE
jgi:hypothetical protein